MKMNYLISLIMFLVGVVLYFFPKSWDTGNIGLKIPFSLEKKSRLYITNKFFGKTLLFGGPISATICFLISISPLKEQINEEIFYYKLTVCIIFILIFFTEIFLRFKNQHSK